MAVILEYGIEICDTFVPRPGEIVDICGDDVVRRFDSGCKAVAGVVLAVLCHGGAPASIAQRQRAKEPAGVRRQFDARIPMRAGVQLSADLWLPREPGRYPVLLMRTPYLKTRETFHFPEHGAYFASRGYVFAVQDVRGRGDSDGVFNFLLQESEDGYDTVEWLAAQPWSNGRVGMLGHSYLGEVQWMAARARPPHLVCIAPTASGGLDGIFNYLGGAVVMGWALPWLNLVSGRVYQGRNMDGLDWDEVFKHRPLLTMDDALGRRVPLYRKFMETPDWDPYWSNLHYTPEVYRSLDIPALHATGWFDGDQPTALHRWRGMAAHSPARDRQYLLAGPWTHDATFHGGRTTLGDMQFSPDSVVDNKAIHLAFFERFLKRSAAAFDFPRARVYVTGLNRWRSFDEYPPAQAGFRKLYLRSGGRANSFAGDGHLEWDSPGDEPADGYTYDPRDPVRSALNSEDEPHDHRAIERRDDVLVYSSAVLREPLEVIGRTHVELFASSDARDTDFTAKILDVYPDGRAVKLGTLPLGVIRARYRNGLDRPELLEPGKAEKFRIDLFDFAHAFLAGHRVRIEISSSGYPFIAPNQNTGNPVATDTEWRSARQTIFHDRTRPSHVALPVMPNR
jgi:putative CocE/NonD family hydrolase